MPSSLAEIHAPREVDAFATDFVVQPPRPTSASLVSALGYLEALTYDFEREGQQVSCVLIYSEPDPDHKGRYRLVVAADSGYEGIACVDDTARAALLALDVYERTHSRKALSLAHRWLTFVEYMQYPDGSFANFIRNAAGIRNATGQTSVKGGYWWSVRALWALARAYRLTGETAYLDSYRRCHLAPLADGKIQAVLALGELELYRVEPSDELRASILDRCATFTDGNHPYFRDQPTTPLVHLWGYHQLHAAAEAARVLDEPSLLGSCRQTVHNLIEPDIKARFWHSFPDRRKSGVCAYDVAPIVQGLSALYRATAARKYGMLALDAAAWFYGRNDARAPMYDPTLGRCRDGITDGVASANCGAESAIEAGFAEMERRELLATT